MLAFVNTHYADPTKLDFGSDFDSLDNSNLDSDTANLHEDENIVAAISANTKFVWKNTAGEAVSWITESGEAFFRVLDVMVAKIGKLVIKEEVVVQKEAKISGTGKFATGNWQVKIESDKVTEDSLIYVTSTTKTDGLGLYIKEKTPGEGFVVALEKPADENLDLETKESTPSATRTIEFNWLLINQE